MFWLIRVSVVASMAIALQWRGAMAFESLLAQTRSHVSTANRLKSGESVSVVLEGRAGDAYNEEAFRHFLEVERTRASRSQRTFLLLLVSLRSSSPDGNEVSRSAAGPLFYGLRECVREIDFIGWYRDRKVAGAVLTQGLDLPGDARMRIVQRVHVLLSRRLPAQTADRLRVRVVQLGAKALL